jgi:hypothetical protein
LLGKLEDILNIVEEKPELLGPLLNVSNKVILYPPKLLSDQERADINSKVISLKANLRVHETKAMVDVFVDKDNIFNTARQLAEILSELQESGLNSRLSTYSKLKLPLSPSPIPQTAGCTLKSRKPTMPQRAKGEVCLDYILEKGISLNGDRLDRIKKTLNESKDFSVDVLNAYRFAPNDKTLGELKFSHRCFAVMDITKLNDLMTANKDSTLFIDQLNNGYFSNSAKDFCEAQKMYTIKPDQKYALAIVNLREDYAKYTVPYRKFKGLRQLDTKCQDSTPLGWVEYIVVYNYEVFENSSDSS